MENKRTKEPRKLSAREMQVKRQMSEGSSVEATLNAGYEKEWNADYVYGFDEGEEKEVITNE